LKPINIDLSSASNEGNQSFGKTEDLWWTRQRSRTVCYEKNVMKRRKRRKKKMKQNCQGQQWQQINKLIHLRAAAAAAVVASAALRAFLSIIFSH